MSLWRSGFTLGAADCDWPRGRFATRLRFACDTLAIRFSIRLRLYAVRSSGHRAGEYEARKH